MLRKAKAPMHSFTAGEPLERMAIDIMGELHMSRKGNKCILVAMDYFTKYTHLIPMPNHKAETVAKALVDEVFTKVGIPGTCTLTEEQTLCPSCSERPARYLELTRP